MVNVKHVIMALVTTGALMLPSLGFPEPTALSLPRTTPASLFAAMLLATTPWGHLSPAMTRAESERPHPIRADLFDNAYLPPSGITDGKNQTPSLPTLPAVTPFPANRAALMPSDVASGKHNASKPFSANVRSQVPDYLARFIPGSEVRMTPTLPPPPKLMTGDTAGVLFGTVITDHIQNSQQRMRRAVAHPHTISANSNLLSAMAGSGAKRTSVPIKSYSSPKALDPRVETKQIAALPLQTKVSSSRIGRSRWQPRRITVQVGMFATLLTKGVKSVAIADPTIADVVVLSTQSVLVNGKSQGTTNLVLLDAGGIHTYEVYVVERVRVSAEEIEKAIGLPNVKVRLVGDAVILDGEVDSNDEAAQAKAIAGLYGQKIVDLLTVAAPAVKEERPDIAKQVREAIPIAGIEVRAIGDAILLQGTVKTESEKQQAERIASLYTAQVVNLIEVEKAPTPPPPSLAEILEMISIPTVRAKEVRDRIILEGEAPNAAAKERAAAIAAQSGKTVDNLIVTPEEKLTAAAAKAKQIEAAIGIEGVKVQATEELFTLIGTVPSQKDADRALQIARSLAPNVESHLQVPKLRQVRIELMIVEMAVNRLRELGFAPGLGTNYITLDASTAFGEGVSGFDSTSAGNIAVTLKALQTKNQAKILSAPSATVLDGKEVDFKVGGEVPLPYTSYGTSGVAGGALTQSVEFKEFGILMNVKPTVLDNDNVNLAIKTEVSQPNYTNAVQIGNSLVPGFDTRNSQTEVVVKHSETLVIGGLIKNELIKNKQALPILSKIPVLGELFQSTSFQRNETELVIFVTPRVLEVK